MAQRQLAVDLHQLQSYSGTVGADTTIRHAGEERVRNNYNAEKKCMQIDYNLLQFFFRYFPQVTTLMEIPQGSTMENSGK
jgi:hypothetical protein